MANESNEAVIGQAIGRASTAATLSLVGIASALIKKGIITKDEIKMAYHVIDEGRMDQDQRDQYYAARDVLLSYL